MARKTGRSMGMSLKTETYITRSPSRYPHNKFTFQTLHLYLAGWTDKKEGSQAAQGNGDAGFTGGLNTEALDNAVRVPLL